MQTETGRSAPDTASNNSSLPFFSACTPVPEQHLVAGRRDLRVYVEREKIYFVMNTIYRVISFMQTSEDESKNLYKL